MGHYSGNILHEAAAADDYYYAADDYYYGISDKSGIEVADIFKLSTGGNLIRSRNLMEGENVSDLSANSRTLKISNENCGGSDLTAETMAERSPIATSSLDYGCIFKLDSAIEAGVNTSGLSELAAGNSKEAQGCYKSYLMSDTEKPEGLKQTILKENLNENLKTDGTLVSGMLMDSIYSAISSSGPKIKKDEDMPEWLELGLASGHHGSKGFQVTKTSETNTKPGSFAKTNTHIRDDHEKDIVFLNSSCHQPYLQTTSLSFSKSEPLFSTEYTSGSYQVSQQAGQEIRRSDFLYPISGPSALLQDTIDKIQPQDYCGNGEFAWTRNKSFGDFIRPGVSDKIAHDRELLSGGLSGRTQYQSCPPYTQPLSSYQSQQREALVQLTSGLEPFSVTQNARISKYSRREAGLWFTLQVAHTQNRECLLPQIPKAYLRIKDGSMTILMVKKYLASKLGLHNESEIEISCKGQQVLPSLSLQHVRDAIWFSSLKLKKGSEPAGRTKTEFAKTPSLSYQNVMILNYQRSLRDT